MVQKGCRFQFSCSSLLIFNHIRPSTCEEVPLFHSWINQKLKLTCNCAHFCKYVKSYPSCRVLVIRVTHVTKFCPHGARCLFQICPHMKLSCHHPSVNHMQLPPAPTQTGGSGISGILFSVFAKLWIPSPSKTWLQSYPPTLLQGEYSFFFLGMERRREGCYPLPIRCWSIKRRCSLLTWNPICLLCGSSR